MVYCIPCLLMCRCPIVVFIDFSILLCINPSMRPDYILRKPSLISLRRLIVVRLKLWHRNIVIVLFLVVWYIMLFNTIFDYCVS